MAETLRQMVVAIGHRAHSVGGAAAAEGRAAVDRAIELSGAQRPVVLHLDEESGLELLPMLTDKDGPVRPTIIFSAHGVSAVAANQVSAALVKSRGSLPDLKATIRRILVDRPRR